MSNVVSLDLVSIGDGVEFDGDKILDEAKGQGLKGVVVIGETPDGDMWLSSSMNTGATLLQLLLAQKYIVENAE